MQAQHRLFLSLLDGSVRYAIPRWQRRYAWTPGDIDTLLADLRTAAGRAGERPHYAGTVLTAPEPTPGTAVLRVVDGQQRLVTVTLLLMRLHELLRDEPEPVGGWSAPLLHELYLTYLDVDGRHEKLRLQNGDHEEYLAVLHDRPPPATSGALTAAWRHLQAKVGTSDIETCKAGLEALHVVRIELAPNDDPQQIFESLNATGRPLTEGEKLKSWLLMGLPDREQQEVHENGWLAIERALDAHHHPERIETFLRDVLRLETGGVPGQRRTYDCLRRHFVGNRYDRDRKALAERLRALAVLYGQIVGASYHPDRGVERELLHQRELGFEVQRPFTLRLLRDVESTDALRDCLHLVSTWLTRVWLSHGAVAGFNRLFPTLAYQATPSRERNPIDHWKARAAAQHTTNQRVPNDADVRDGIRSRKAYGGKATATTKAILAALMEDEQRDEAPARDRLTVEHILPQALTDPWRGDLGEDADRLHAERCQTLPNLTLIGHDPNAKLGTLRFTEKRDRHYAGSAIAMTRRLAEIQEWDEAALDERAEDLARRACALWEWSPPATPKPAGEGTRSPVRWRLDGGPWHGEPHVAALVLNVVAEVLDQDPANVDRIVGSTYQDLQVTGTQPNNHARRFRPIPRHREYGVYPYGNYDDAIDRARNLAARCGLVLEATETDATPFQRRFWRLVDRDRLPGAHGNFNALMKRISVVPGTDDEIKAYVGNADSIWLYALVNDDDREARSARAAAYSDVIAAKVNNERLGTHAAREAREGRTIGIHRAWDQGDEMKWSEVAAWLVDQAKRLRAILRTEQGDPI